jgi:hypothetical protein
MSTMVSKRAAALGLKKVDAKQHLTLEVTRSDISIATQKNPTCCAFAMAALRTMPKIRHAYFFRSCAWLEYPDKMVRYTLPKAMVDAIAEFDKNGTMKPSVYNLTKPGGSQKMDRLKQRAAKRPGRHQPADTKIKRGVVHQSSQIRARFEPTVG